MKGDWTPWQINTLIEMAAAPERYTAEMIGDKINKTRSAVIGKINRDKIFWNNSAKTDKVRKAKQPKTVPLVKFFLHHGWVK